MDNRDSLVEANTNSAAVALLVEELTGKIATARGDIIEKDGYLPFRVTPDGQIASVASFRIKPLVRKGVVEFYEALSFSRFVNRFKNTQTVIFADALGRKFTAAVDYHPAGGDQQAATADLFRATLPLKHTPSWIAWTGVDKKAMDQETFAQFLEDQIPDIADPDAATLVQIARTLEAKSEVSFESHIRAQNGAHRFVYVESISGTAQGTMEIPAELTLVLQPFEGSKQYEVKARFRYRITSKKLSMWFELVRPQDVLKAAFDDELLKIEDEVNNTSNGRERAKDDFVTPIYNGPAPTAAA